MGTAVALVVAVLIAFVVVKIGLGMIRSMGAPMAPPPEPGELRRVNLRYRCSICGTEITMTRAAEELPEPPRHCQEDMDLVAPIE
jgi:hypothetical protein